MRISWIELEAVKMAGVFFPLLLSIIFPKDSKQLKDSMNEYAALPQKIQCALGYMRCLIESDMGTRSAYGRLISEQLGNKRGNLPLMRYPMRFVGWGGRTNDIGPVYEIDGKCYIAEKSRLFYTDSDICKSIWKAEELAAGIKQESLGIADVRVKKLGSIRTINEDMWKESWCVTCCLKETISREVVVNGKPLEQMNGKALLILPKSGEFNCMLGETVNGNPANAFVLQRHSFCMK